MEGSFLNLGFKSHYIKQTGCSEGKVIALSLEYLNEIWIYVKYIRQKLTELSEKLSFFHSHFFNSCVQKHTKVNDCIPQ